MKGMTNMQKQTLTITELESRAREMRLDIISMLEKAGSGHSAGPLGMADILAALYLDIMKIDPSNPNWDERDIFLLSNGHTAPVQYAAMAQAGFFPREELLTLRQLGSRLQGHPERSALPGLENTSGPLGSGLSQACGMSLGMRLNGQQHKRWIYVCMGDGELDEGNVWEAMMFASKYKLFNVIGIIDRNNIQIDGHTEDIMPLEDLHDKWKSFGWHVQEVDGHNIESIIDACSMARAITEKPSVIIAHTIPGKGIEMMEYDYKWHGIAPNSEQAKEALENLRSLNGKVVCEGNDCR